jgi:hypothetical protein
MTQTEKNEQLARDLMSQIEEVIDDFVRDNLDMDLDMDDLVDQHTHITDYIKENLFR